MGLACSSRRLAWLHHAKAAKVAKEKEFLQNNSLRRGLCGFGCDAPEGVVGADENGAIGNGEGSVHRFAANGVGGQAVKFWSRAEDENVRVFVVNVEAISGE